MLQEVLRFLEQLIMCMGQNMQFNVEHIWEGNDYAAGVNWHLGKFSTLSKWFKCFFLKGEQFFSAIK